MTDVRTATIAPFQAHSLYPFARGGLCKFGRRQRNVGTWRIRSIVTLTTACGPSRHIALPHELVRYRGKADVAFVASRGRVYGYTA
jgi:hypothetical protein